MDKLRGKADLFGRLALVLLVGFLLVKYNYDISQFLILTGERGWRAWHSLEQQLESAMDAASILGHLFLLLVAIVYLLVTLVLIFVVGGSVLLLAKLSEYYLLPVIFAFAVAYSGLSYRFFGRPVIWTLARLREACIAVIRFIKSMTQFLLIEPLADVIYFKKRPRFRMYRLLTALLFLVGSLCLLVGIAGISVSVFRNRGIMGSLDSFLSASSQSGLNQTGQAQNDPDVEFVLDSHQPGWTDCDYPVIAGSILMFSVTGTANCDPQVGWLGPAGTNYAALQLTRGNEFLLPSAHVFAVIGRVGDQKFEIGQSAVIECESTRLLSLAINERWGRSSWNDNSGQFTIRVKVVRRGPK